MKSEKKETLNSVFSKMIQKEKKSQLKCKNDTMYKVKAASYLQLQVYCSNIHLPPPGFILSKVSFFSFSFKADHSD